MLFDYVCSLKNYDTVFFAYEDVPTHQFIIPINDLVIGRKPELFQQLHNSKHHFCFSITVELKQYSDKFIKEEIIQNLVRILFLPNYLRLNGKHVFFVQEEAGQNKLDSLKQGFCKELKKQGINDVIFEVLHIESFLQNQSDEQGISISLPGFNAYLNSDTEASFETFIDEFSFPPSFNKKWIVHVRTPDDFQQKMRLINRFEKWVLDTKPFIAQLIQMWTVQNHDSVTLRSQNKVLAFKLENSRYYLKMIRHEAQNYVNEVTRLRSEVDSLIRHRTNPVTPVSLAPVTQSLDNQAYMMQLQSQIDAAEAHGNVILEWYKKEYEVLPVWYKKFGHIIKVATGKRTFKSLFK